MRWGVYLVFLVIAATLDTSFSPVFAVGTVQPSFVPILVAFVVMSSQRWTALWAAFVAGLLVDLLNPALYDGTRPYSLIGPTALGFVFGAQILLPLRTMVVRRNPLTLGVLTILLALAVAVVTTAIFSARGWYAGTLPPWLPEGRALGYLGHECLDALASGALAVVISVPLHRVASWFAFSGTSPWSSRR